MIKYILFGILMGFCAAPLCHSGPSITILRGQDFPPYHFLDQNGREKGFIIEMISRTAEQMDLKVQFKQYPWSRCLRLVQSGEADAMMNLFKTPERTTFMYFPETFLVRETNRFFVLRGSGLSYQGDLAELRGMKIGTIRNYSYGKAFDEYADQLTILELETEKALIMNLIGQRCNTILGNDLVIQSLARKIHGGDKILPSGPEVTNDPLYIGFSKARGHENLAENFSLALDTFKACPDFKEMKNRYGF